MSQTALAEMLGIKLARVSNWFQGRNFPRTRERVELARRLGVRLEWLIHGLGDPENFSSDPVVNEAVAEYGVETHQVPVISWAHAGAAAAYEEMPRHFMGKISAMSRDTRAFALIVEGDSMEPKIVAGDRVVCEPSSPLVNGRMVVAKHLNEGVQLRIYYRLPSGRIRLAPANPVYLPFEYDPDSFLWIYPVTGLYRPL